MTPLAMLFVAATATYHLPKGLLSGLCYVESEHKPSVIHHDDGDGNSIGVCQVKTSTARLFGFRGSESDLLDPKTNIKYAAIYLRWQLNRYRGNVLPAIGAYNSGTLRTDTRGRPKNWNYTVKVINAWGHGK